MSSQVRNHEFSVDAVPASSLHKVFEDTARWAADTGRQPNNLHVGEPIYSMPETARRAMIDAIAQGDCGYTGAVGRLDLRTRLAERAQASGIDTDPSLIAVTPGSCQGLAAIGRALHDPGAAMLIPSVHWPIYRQQAIVNDYELIGYPLGENYEIQVDAIAAASTPNTRVLLINSPANPTGYVCPPEVLRDLLDLACERDWMVICDEAYEDFVFGGTHVSVASLEADLDPDRRRVFSTFTFSKSYAMTGCRVGYVVAPNPAFADRLRRVQEATIIAAPTPSQIGALAALDASDEVERNVEYVRASRDAAMEILLPAGLIARPPGGGWYAMLDVGSSGRGAVEFSEALLDDYGVGVAPAAAFSFPGDASTDATVRISLAGDRDQLIAGCREIVAACERWGSQGGGSK